MYAYHAYLVSVPTPAQALIQSVLSLCSLLNRSINVWGARMFVSNCNLHASRISLRTSNFSPWSSISTTACPQSFYFLLFAIFARIFLPFPGLPTRWFISSRVQLLPCNSLSALSEGSQRTRCLLSPLVMRWSKHIVWGEFQNSRSLKTYENILELHWEGDPLQSLPCLELAWENSWHVQLPRYHILLKILCLMFFGKGVYPWPLIDPDIPRCNGMTAASVESWQPMRCFAFRHSCRMARSQAEVKLTIRRHRSVVKKGGVTLGKF